jgi:MoaA/NifB/PqqE/SkfB family radical SAM enzyme
MSPDRFAYHTVDEYQIEVTSYCNAACPQCPRNINGGDINPHMPLMHLPREVIDRVFPQSLCQDLRQIFFCGSYGDPIMHPEFLDVLKDFRSKNPSLWLYFHTNGGVHEPEYWIQIAHILGPHGQIDFGIDGLEDTLQWYRRNVSYDKVIRNARAFIDAGGRAQWNYIVFKHNEHQVEQAREIAENLRFHRFRARKTGRFFHHGTEQALDSWPVHNRRNKKPVFWLEPPDNPFWNNSSVQKLPNLKHNPQGDLDQYFKTTPISCDALLGRKVVITAEGLVLPCNFFTHNLYDARFHEDVLPGANARHMTSTGNQVREFLESYGLDSLNIHNHDLQQIFDNPMWSDLIQSWTGPERLFECAMTCGEKFRKVWDQ